MEMSLDELYRQRRRELAAGGHFLVLNAGESIEELIAGVRAYYDAEDEWVSLPWQDWSHAWGPPPNAGQISSTVVLCSWTWPFGAKRVDFWVSSPDPAAGISGDLFVEALERAAGVYQGLTIGVEIGQAPYSRPPASLEQLIELFSGGAPVYGAFTGFDEANQ